MKLDKMIKNEVIADYTIAKAKMEVVKSIDDSCGDSLKDFTEEVLKFSGLISYIRENIFTRMRHIQSKECAELVLNMIYKMEGEENMLEDGVKDYTGKHISAKKVDESISKIAEEYETFRKAVDRYGMLMPELSAEIKGIKPSAEVSKVSTKGDDTHNNQKWYERNSINFGKVNTAVIQRDGFLD